MFVCAARPVLIHSVHEFYVPKYEEKNKAVLHIEAAKISSHSGVLEKEHKGGM